MGNACLPSDATIRHMARSFAVKMENKQTYKLICDKRVSSAEFKSL